MRILVIDDDEVDRMIVRRAVSGGNSAIQVEEAGSAAEADAKLAEATYDYLEGLSLLVEPSGAAPLAAIRSGATRIGRKTVLVVSGGNAQPAVLAQILADRR